MKIEDIKTGLSDGTLKLIGNKVYTSDEWEQIRKIEIEAEHYDLLQNTKKITSNSAYGALLSEFFKFGRKEMGASVTACGRYTTKFMLEQVGELINGKKTNIIKNTNIEKDGHISNTYTSDNEAILLSDTDSCYFKTYTSNKEEAIQVSDFVAEEINTRFSAFMRKAFNCQPWFDERISASREIVGSSGLFLNAKKKYTIKMVNKDGFDLDPPKLKTVGSEMKKADTPKVIQNFLKGLMNLILDGKEYEEVEKFINEQRIILVREISNPISLGVPKQINNLDDKYLEWQRTEKIGKGKVNLPGHVRAAINYNELVKELDPGNSRELRAGDKGLIFYIKMNSRGLKSIAFPSELDTFPKWFLENFELDKKLSEQKMIDSKLERIFEALNWEIPTPQKTFVKKYLKF